jgi:tetratricopeptide (TPR) repeat protein
LGALTCFEIGLWAWGVKPAYYTSDPYAGFTPQVPHFQTEKDGAGQETVTLVPSKRESFNDQRFLKHKPPGTFRIICLGGSATYGRPYWDHTSFPGWLRMFLPKADPSRTWEVINAGAISYASYRIKGLMAELAQFEPDMFVVYTGENEFLERRTYASVFETPGLLRNAAGLASRLRLATVSQRGLDLAGFLGKDATNTATQLREEVTTISIRSVGPEAYTRNEAFQKQVLSHYEAGLNAMVDLAAEAKARLLFVTPVSNLRDFAPFKSENRTGLSAEILRAWNEAYEKGRALLKQARPADAVQAFQGALTIDNRHADLLYRTGQALLALGKDGEARDFFIRAKDEDICPLRALSATLEAMRKVAHDRGVPLLDWEAMASAGSTHRIPGEELLADHVHLQIPGSRLLAVDILERLAAEKIVTLAPGWGPKAIDQVARRVEADIDRGRYAQEIYSLSKLLDALGQTEQAQKRVEEGLKLSGGDLDGFCLAGRYAGKLGKPQAALDFFHEALTRQPGAACAEEGMGAILLDQGKPEHAIPHLEAAARSAPASPAVLNLLGVAHSLSGNPEMALPLFRRASELLPNEPAIHRNLALAQERLGQGAEAVLHYRHALRLDPADPTANLGLKRLLARSGRPVEEH